MRGLEPLLRWFGIPAHLVSDPRRKMQVASFPLCASGMTWGRRVIVCILRPPERSCFRINNHLPAYMHAACSVVHQTGTSTNFLPWSKLNSLASGRLRASASWKDFRIIRLRMRNVKSRTLSIRYSHVLSTSLKYFSGKGLVLVSVLCSCFYIACHAHASDSVLLCKCARKGAWFIDTVSVARSLYGLQWIVAVISSPKTTTTYTSMHCYVTWIRNVWMKLCSCKTNLKVRVHEQ